MFNRSFIYSAENAAAAAWPAKRTEIVDGWRVRLSGGGSRRANSVLPLHYSGVDIETTIDRVEQLYRAQNTRSYVQVSAIAQPADLDARLAARGYAYEEPCLLMAKILSKPPALVRSVVETLEPSPAWLAIYTELLEPTRKAAAPAILATVAAPRMFFLVTRDGVPVATALGVVREKICVVECVATRSDVRRSGGAAGVMDALETWAIGRGCVAAALQVVAENAPAIGLYQKRGYTEAGRYHYRWKHV